MGFRPLKPRRSNRSGKAHMGIRQKSGGAFMYPIL
jgi:hypothetical protein